jgi:hypothetical protein
MPRGSDTISPEQEIEILQFWAQAMDIKRKFTPEQIQSVRGLSEAIEAALKLPDEIGWGEERSVGRRAGEA